MKKSKSIEESKHLDCMLLLMIHRRYGKGKKALIEFHKDFIETFRHFENFYEDDGNEIAKIKLRQETGIDIDELYEKEGIV